MKFDASPANSKKIFRKDLPVWQIPMWVNLLLLAAPLLGLGHAFGAPVSRDFWLVLGGLALTAAIFGRKHPLNRIHPLVWHRKPWTFLISSLILWLFLQFFPLSGTEGVTLGYRVASLLVAGWLVLFTTTGGDDAPIFRRSDRRV